MGGMRMKTCSFCEMYDINQEINKHHSEFPTTFRAAIVHVNTIRGQKVRTHINYIKNGLGAPLRYCPECGKKLKGKKRLTIMK